MTKFFSLIALLIICCLISYASLIKADDWRPYPKANLPDFDETGRPLPPGVPRVVDTNGKVLFIEWRFTTPLYRHAAFRSVLEEANQVARELNLPEKLPITESNIVEYDIGPFGFNYAHRTVGFVSTETYCYYVARGDKFSSLVNTHEQENCQKYLAEGYSWPVSQINTNEAYQLATQWLSAVHMDVAGLNHDCRVSVTVDTVYAEAPPGRFIPIYWVVWIPGDGVGVMASVRLFAPTKTLLDFSVEDSKYILRKPLVFTNLAALFPGTARIYTNHPVPPVYMAAPPP